MTRPKRTQSGFSLLEAIVAMVVMATAMLALYAWLSSSTLGLTRAQAQTRALADARTALALVETINAMLEPSGQRQLGDIEVSWQATPVAPRRTGLTRAGKPSLYEVALYDMEVTVRRDGTTDETFTLRRAGFEAVRALSETDK